jgi:ubiquinone/menaquinone biosynthesis C-methylase UbiE
MRFVKGTRQAFFNRAAERWDTLHYSRRTIDRALAGLIPRLRVNKDAYVIDIGCGTGILSGKLAEVVGTKGKVFCCDFSLPMLQHARHKIKDNCVFLCADVHALPFSERSFDAAILFSCFPHFEDKRKVFAEVSRVLKTGGTVTISHLGGRREITAIHRRVSGVVAKDRIPHAKWMSMQVSRAGFDIIEFIDRRGLYFLQAKKLRGITKTSRSLQLSLARKK